jgi:hypothetical protein
VSTVAEIEDAISKLPSEDFRKLEQWFELERNRKWDRQIEADSNAGALDSILAEVEGEIKSGRTRPTDELCDNR